MASRSSASSFSIVRPDEERYNNVFKAITRYRVSLNCQSCMSKNQEVVHNKSAK